ncbi:MAG: hypothetical protein B7Z55_07770 [Planctomycetales bacterium 12-60-4]|nr:MAG: hypothetical protein B7Z55_07770 [Planctomycetales bacterium 12-60-4]
MDLNMTRFNSIQRWAAALLTASAVGCASKGPKTPVADIQPAPLGSISDPIWQQQEENAEASDFVIYEHEWVGNSSRLNAAGMEHVKQIAARAAATPFPVLVERSSMSVDSQSQHLLPVNGREDLDAERRNLIAHALVQMGVSDADQRVLVAPALTPGFQDFEGESAYNQGFSENGNINGGFGGGFGLGGFGGGGGFF